MQLRQFWLNWWWVVLSVPHDNKGDLSLTPQVWVDAFFSPCLWIALPHVRESKTLLYSGFHAADSRYCIPVFDSGTWILDSNRYWDSGLLELFSGFHKQNFPGLQIPEIPYIGWKLLLSAPFLAETFWLNVVHWGQVRTHRRTCLWNKSPETKIQYLLSCLPICITWVLWRFKSELQLDRSAKKERKKKNRETLLGAKGWGTYFPHSLNFKTRRYAYNVLKKKPCIIVFALFFVAVAVLTHLCVVCRHFSCPLSLFHGHAICRPQCSVLALFLHIIVWDGLSLQNFFNFKNQFSNKCSVFQLFTSGVGTSKRRCGACLWTASSKVWREIQKRVW